MCYTPATVSDDEDGRGGRRDFVIHQHPTQMLCSGFHPHPLWKDEYFLLHPGGGFAFDLENLSPSVLGGRPSPSNGPWEGTAPETTTTGLHRCGWSSGGRGSL